MCKLVCYIPELLEFSTLYYIFEMKCSMQKGFTNVKRIHFHKNRGFSVKLWILILGQIQIHNDVLYSEKRSREKPSQISRIWPFFAKVHPVKSLKSLIRKGLSRKMLLLFSMHRKFLRFLKYVLIISKNSFLCESLSREIF